MNEMAINKKTHPVQFYAPRANPYFVNVVLILMFLIVL
jgi:hypothetical protein